MADRLPNVGERVGFVDDGYTDRTGTVMGVGDFYHCPMLYVRPDGEWPADELGEDGTLSLTAEECWELEPEPDGDATAPWDDGRGCFGHCDPEGWFRPCRTSDGSGS